jgi:hypothetical protein
MSLLDRPYAKTMRFAEMRDGDGRLVVFMDFDTSLLGRPGFLHGGAIAGLLESAGFATLTEAIGEHPAPRLKPVNVTVTCAAALKSGPSPARRLNGLGAGSPISKWSAGRTIPPSPSRWRR